MKKILSVLLSVLMIASLFVMVSCGQQGEFDALKADLQDKLEGDYTNDLAATTLYVYNWGEYMSDGEDDSLDINKAFEAVTGIHVEYSTYASNEAMYATLSGGGVNYDIVIPSDYMVARLIAEDMVQKIDYSKLSNYKYINEEFKNPDYDKNNEYSIPYAGGYLGVIYNNTIVDEKDIDGTWSLLWNEKYKGQILGIDNARDALAISQLSLGISLNTTDLAEWDKAAEHLTEAVPLYQTWAMDEIFAKMEGENAAIATYYAGDYLTMVDDMNEATGNGDHLSMYYPSEGTNVFFDACCVLKNSQNYEAALLYLNFLMDPYIALQNAEYIKYTCPNTAVSTNTEYSLFGNEYLYPKEEIKSEFYSHLDADIVSYYETLFNKVKSAG